MAVVVCGAAQTANVQASEGAAGSSAVVGMRAELAGMDVATNYALGVARFDVDSHTEITGWRLSPEWYFGHQDGLDSGLTLVWQSKRNQLSLSKDGLRLTRRF